MLFGRLSGGHFNPCVSLTLMIQGEIDFRRVNQIMHLSSSITSFLNSSGRPSQRSLVTSILTSIGFPTCKSTFMILWECSNQSTGRHNHRRDPGSHIVLPVCADPVHQRYSNHIKSYRMFYDISRGFFCCKRVHHIIDQIHNRIE